MGKANQNIDEEMLSWSSMPADHNWGRYYNYACVYFANNEWELDGQDKKKLESLRTHFKKLLEANFWIYLDTIGSASAPGKSKYNMDLSMKRSNEVLKFFKDKLGSETRFICGRAFYGDKYARPQRRFHSGDRKVIVRAKIVMGRDPNSPFREYENVYIARVKIFKNYSPHYEQWRRRGLYYLVEEWERLWEYASEENLVFKEQDIDKVIDLLRHELPFSVKNRFENDLAHGNQMQVVKWYYHPLYRRYYHEAYDLFSKVDDMNVVADILSQSY